MSEEALAPRSPGCRITLAELIVVVIFVAVVGAALVMMARPIG